MTKNKTMKKIYLILILVLVTLFNTKASTSEAQTNQENEQIITKADTISSENSAEPIIKTVVIEEDEEGQDPFSPRNKWITIALAVFGVVLVLVFRMLRKKKKAVKNK